jgi:hypothetical protein
MWELKSHEYIENHFIMDRLKARLQAKRVSQEWERGWEWEWGCRQRGWVKSEKESEKEAAGKESESRVRKRLQAKRVSQEWERVETLKHSLFYIFSILFSNKSDFQLQLVGEWCLP